MPMSMLGGMASGGVSAGSSASGQSGPADGANTTGEKVFNFGGGNPNTAAGMLQNPVVLIAIVAAVYLVAKK